MIYFCEKLVHIKYKRKDFKTALLEILKEQEEKRKKKKKKKYEQSLEKFEELFVEQQRKMLASNKNGDLGIFFTGSYRKYDCWI